MAFSLGLSGEAVGHRPRVLLDVRHSVSQFEMDQCGCFVDVLGASHTAFGIHSHNTRKEFQNAAS
jgi:hypothetical protein